MTTNTTLNQTFVKTPAAMFSKLRLAEKKQASLYLFCNFISLLLITAYAAMMFSPTVLLVLPEGGDSRKQMTAIFVLALFGCIVFTIYAASLFFRKKSRLLGTLMALGASRRYLAPNLYKEVLLLSGSSSLLGILAGFPFVWIIWNGFRLLIVDSAEMKLVFDFRCLYLSALFFVIVVAFSCLMAHHYLKRTNIMDTIHEEHKNEPVKKLGRWCGPVGFVLLFAGAIAGYLAPRVYTTLLNAYWPPAWLNLFYAPVFVGLYLIMLHTVVHGWRSHRKQPYKNIVSRSMMKFQGRQTVNNLLVSTVLIAGASFAIFYIPMLSVGQLIDIANRPFDYSYRYPLTQNIMGKDKVKDLAAKYGLITTDWKETDYLVLAMDGFVETEGENNQSVLEYRDLCMEGRFFSETAFNDLTGSSLSVAHGSYYMISNDTETGTYWGNQNASMLTNMDTNASIPVSFAGYAHYTYLAAEQAFYVLNDADYETIAKGLTAEWIEHFCFFNIAGEDSYAFAKDFFYTIVDSYDPEYAVGSYYDRVEKRYYEKIGETWWGDTDTMTKLSFDNPDSTEFRSYWAYMPKITVLDRTDFVRTYAVYLMMFLFISIICILAAVIICYARCMTIALNNRYVFDDLRKLGASPSFLRKELKNQAANVFKTPAAIGMGAMFFLYFLLMYGNDGVMTIGEIGGLAVCLVLLAVIGAIIHGLYRYTMKNMAGQLGIPTRNF